MVLSSKILVLCSRRTLYKESYHKLRTKNTVPNKSIKNGKLGDIAPTILALMGIEKPAIMTGFNLVN